MCKGRPELAWEDVVKERQRFVPYSPIEHHGVIGDRRTAALIASDGTLDCLYLPDL